MGLIDKLKGHRRDESRKSFDEVAEEKKSHRRSSSLARKSSTKRSDRSAGAASDVPPLPGTNARTQLEPTTATYDHNTTDAAAVVAGHNAYNASHDVNAAGTGTNGTAHHAVERKAVPATDDDAAAAATTTTTATTHDATTTGQGLRGGSTSEAHATDGVDGVTEGFSKLHIPVSDPRFDRSVLSDKPFDLEGFFGNKQTSTKTETINRQPVVQERIQPTVKEIIHPVFHREHHITHHQTRIQPVLEQIILPAKHYVIINGEKHEIQAEAIMTHVLQKRDFIPVETRPQITVRSYVGSEPVMGPILPQGLPSLINKEVEDEHRRMINASYEPNADKAHAKEIPASVLNRGPGETTFSGYPPTKLEATHAPGFVPTKASADVVPVTAPRV